MKTGAGACRWAFLIAAVLSAAAGYGQTAATSPTPAEAQTKPTATAPDWLAISGDKGYPDDPRIDDSPLPRVPAEGVASTAWPDLSLPTLAWFGAIVVLALTLRSRPALSVRNIDGIVLAATCALLAFRPLSGTDPADSAAWWAALLLALAALYWLLRGFGLLLTRAGPVAVELVPRSVLAVFLLAGLALCVHRLVTTPLSEVAETGVLGGEIVAETGRLPYGNPPAADYQSPLVYLLHAGVIRALPAGGDTAGTLVHAARLSGAVLLALMVLGLLIVGRRLHSPAAGLLMVTLFCVSPGALESLSRPDSLIPAVLLVWTLVFALLPVFGGLLATACLVLAGVAWPWAWLGLPVLLAYFLRRGWAALGSLLGLAGGVALLVFGLLQLVQPALPRETGALATAGLRPTYAARQADDGTVLIDRRDVEGEEVPSSAFSRRLWRALITNDATLVRSPRAVDGVRIDFGNDVDAQQITYWRVSPAPRAAPALQATYREALAQAPAQQRLLANARTVLEATWLAEQRPAPPARSTWDLWGTAPGDWARRLVKLAVVLLVLWLAVAVLLGRRNRPRHLVGGLLVVAAATLLASAPGPANNLVWLLAAVLPLWALRPDAPSALVPQAVAAVPAEPAVLLGAPEPRVTVER